MKVASACAARLVAAFLSIFCLALLSAAHAQGVVRNQAQSSAPSPSRYKAIWEPVNYTGDFDLYSVFFATGKVGWVGGAGHYNKGGVILYTTDGGEHWQIQLGDPGSNEPPFEHLYFLDAQHGWAVQSGSKLLRTSDGKNWEDAGAFPKFNPLMRYAFTSPQRGIELAGYANKHKIFLTQDGGRSWKEQFDCVTQLQVQGLTKRLGCSLFDLSFPSERIGYAVGGAFNGGFFVVAKTEDGGASWRMIFASTDLDTGEAVFFTDETHGVIRLRDHKLIATDDGGQTWRGIPSSALGRIRFADPSVGWSCAPRSCAVTTDGGAHWVSRDLHLPADVRSFSAPRRDRVFVVGNHGMVYRYRIVPADFSAKNIADAPPVPGYGSELDAQVTSMQATVQDLQAKASGAPGDAFVQDPGFTQDVATLETGVGGFSQQAPAFASNYRNLNLLFVGLNMLDDLSGRAAGIRDAFQALKNATDLKSASAALQDLAAKLQDTQTTLSGEFQNLAAGGAAPAGNGAAGNMLGSAPPATAPAAPANADKSAQGGDAAGQAVGQAAGQVTNALKKFIHF